MSWQHGSFLSELNSLQGFRSHHVAALADVTRACQDIGDKKNLEEDCLWMRRMIEIIAQSRRKKFDTL